LGTVRLNAAKQRLIAENEEERGEWATLLDPTEDIDPVSTRGADARGDFDSMEEVAHKVDEAIRKAQPGENQKDPGVINRVESFLKVQGEDIVLTTGIESIIESGCKVDDMLIALTTPDKAHLFGANERFNSRHNGVGRVASKDTIISVGNRERAGVLRTLSLLFGKEV
jgi:hypothetical protein